MHQWQRSARVWRALAFLCVFCGFAAQPVYADGSVSSLRLGYGAPTAADFAHFQSVVAQYNASGERFRIDSHCQSACTMFLSIRNVCVSPGATLLFHAGGTPARGPDPAYTQMMLSTYNSALQQYITAGHYMDTLTFHSIPGSVIIKRFGYPACR
jgi:hypothetical protein